MITKIKRHIYVTFQRKGIHMYPDAGVSERLSDVSYLASPHRHLFKFRIQIEVFHNDREVEFHQFLNWIESFYDSGVLELNNKSCEMIAMDLAEKIVEKYSLRDLKIEVSEDGECGAILVISGE